MHVFKNGGYLGSIKSR